MNPAYMSRAAEEFLKPNALGMNCEVCLEEQFQSDYDVNGISQKLNHRFETDRPLCRSLTMVYAVFKAQRSQ